MAGQMVDNKYLSAGVYLGSMSFKGGYGNPLLPKSSNGVDLTIGFKVHSMTFIEAGLSYGFDSSKKFNGTLNIPGGDGAYIPNADLTNIKTSIHRANFGIIGKFPLSQNQFNFILGVGASYTTINASWEISNTTSALLSKTGMAPYFKAGLEYKLTDNSYLGLQYNYVALSALGTMSKSFLDEYHYINQNNNTQIPVLLKPTNLNTVLITYSITF